MGVLLDGRVHRRERSGGKRGVWRSGVELVKAGVAFGVARRILFRVGMSLGGALLLHEESRTQERGQHVRADGAGCQGGTGFYRKVAGGYPCVYIRAWSWALWGVGAGVL